MEPKTKVVECQFTASFRVKLTVPVDATPEDIGKELANVNIPENEECEYISDTFEPETDNNGDPKIFN